MHTRYAAFYVFHTYKPSFAIVFLILAGAAAAKFTNLTALLIVLGYSEFDFLDSIAKRKDIEKMFEQETEWEQDKEDSEHENRGNLTLLRLTGSDQIIVTRFGEMLRRMPR